MEERGGRRSYAERATDVARWAAALRASAVGPGTVIGVSAADRYTHLAIILAAEVVGAISLSLSAGDLNAGSPLLGHCGFFCVDRPVVGADLPSITLTADTIARVAALPVSTADLGPLRQVMPDDRVLRLTNTSGTTGQPKLVAMTQRLTRLQREGSLRHPNDPGHLWNVISVYPLVRRGNQREVESAICLGFTTLFSMLDAFPVARSQFESFHTSIASGDAMTLARMVAGGATTAHPATLRIYGGHLPWPARRVLAERMVTEVVEVYSSKEVQMAAMIDPDRVATPIRGIDVRMVDEAGRVVPDGDVGLIELRSEHAVDGYVSASDAESGAFHNGWYRSKDLGRMLPDGRFQLLDRADDVLVIGGIKTSPAAYEYRLLDLPGVTEAVLLAIPGHDRPDRVRVVLETDQPLDSVAAAAAAIVSPGFAHFDIVTVSTMPRTATGKVRRPALRTATD